MPQEYSDFRSQYRSYLRDPDAFSLDEVDRMEKEAQRTGMIFRRQETSADIGSVVSNVWNGFVQGFTTLPVGDKPTNEVDGIAHSIGHLLGFIGVFSPGGIAAKAGIGITRKVAGKTIMGAKGWLGRSVPMQVADFTRDKIRGTAIANTALKSIDDIAGKRAGLAHQMLRHGTHLGVASAVSSVWDNMEHAEDVPDYLASQFWTAAQGGIFGATFAGIGNMPIPKALSSLNVGPVTGKDVLKGVAGSLAQTVPGAMAGATNTENVYNALLGGFFGFKAQPWAYEKAYKRQNDAARQAENESMDFEWYKTTGEWKSLSKVERKAEEDVYRTLFAKGDAGEVSSHLLTATDLGDPVAKPRPATVLDRHKKFGGQSVEVLNEMETMARVRVGGQDKPVNIRKEYLRFEDEVVDVKSVKEKAKTLQQEIESVERETGNDSIEIPIVRPVENFFKKIKGVDSLSELEYVRNLESLNRIIVGEVNKVKGERISEEEYKKKLTESGRDAEGVLKDLIENEGLELRLPNNYAQRHRIGTIKTRDIAKGEDPKTGSRGVGKRAMDAIKDLWVALDRKKIDIEVKPGTTEEFYKKMGFKFVDKKGEDGKYRYTFDTTPLIDAFQKKSKFSLDDPKTTPWSVVKNDILNRFKDKGITEEDMGEIRNFYRRSTESIKVPRFSLMKGKLVEEKEFDFNNNRITNEESVKLIHRIAAEKGIVKDMSDTYFTVKNAVLYKGGKRVQDKIGSVKLDGKRYRSVVKMASDMGYYPYSGKSDSQTLIFMKKNLGENYKEEYNRIQSDLQSIDPKFPAEYKALRAQAIHKKRGNLNPKDFDEMFVSNVRWWEALNGDVSIKEMANNKGYLNDVMNFNKRQQVLFNNYYPLTSDTFTKPFKYVVVNNLHESSDPAIKKILKKWSPEHDDGYVLVRMDKLDLMASDMGLPSHSGFAKPFLTSNYSATEGKLGTLIGKLSFQGASPEMTKAMKEAGVDFIIPTSVAKQYGNRTVIDHNYNGKEIGFSSNGKTIGKDTIGNFIYDMLPSEVSVDWNTKDGSYKKIQNGEMVKVFKQVQEKFMNYDVQKKMLGIKHKGKPIDINKVMNSFLRDKFDGNDTANKLLFEYLEAGKRNPDMLKRVEKHFNKMGLKEVVEGMKDRTEAGEALRELVRHKVTRMEFDGMEDKSINVTKDWGNDFQKEKLTNTQQILENAGTSDGVAMGKRIAPYMDRALTNYLLKRILQPQVTGSKGIMRGYHLDLALRKDPYGNTSRLLKENDIFFLDNNMEGLRMQILKPSGRKTWGTLKEQWELYLAEKDGTPMKKQMEEMMRSIVTRSPIDGISGIADLKFAGFTGIKGGGILLHPDTMKRLGGADLDIDSANFYMNSLPREVHKISDAFKNDFSDIMNHVRTKTMPSKNKKLNKKFGDPKSLIKAFIAKDGMKGRKSFVGMFDPYLRAVTANTIQDASGKMRGIAVNAQRDIRLLYATAKRSPGKKLIHEDADGNKVIFYPRQGEMDLKAKSWAAVGVTVDVANYGKLKSPEFFKAFLLDSGFRKVEVIPKKGKKYVMDFNQYLDYFKYEGEQVVRFTDSPISEFQNTMNKFYGKDWKTGLPWTRRDIIDAAEAHPKWDTSAYSQLAKLIKSVDYTDTMYERYQYNINNFRNYFNQLNQIAKESPEITRYVGGNKGFKGAYVQDLAKRMEVLNRFYSPDRTNQSIYNQPYNLATTEGVKRLAYNKEMFNDFIESHTITLKNGKDKNFITESTITKNKKGEDVVNYKNKTYSDYKANETSEGREYFLRRYIKQINDFIDNDMEVFTSLKTINDIGRQNNIKADSHLPRYNLEEGGDQLSSLNKVFMDLATEVKNDFATSYNENRYNKRISANSTSLDQIIQRLEGNDPMSIKNIVKNSVTYLNQNKRPSDPELTEKGLRQYFDSLLLGSINKDGKTQSFYFTPQLVSREVLTQFNLNKQWAFKSSFERPSRAQLEKRLEGENDVRVAKEAAALNKTVEEMEVLAPTKRISELDPDLQGYYSRITKQLKILRERSGVDASTLDNFQKGFFTIRGKGSTAEIDKYDLRGFESFLKDINNGSGLFKFITRGKSSKYFDWLREMSEDGKLKMALGPYLKMSESVAFDHLVNNFKLIERNVTAAKWVWKKDPETGKNIRVKEYGTYKAWAPQSHFGEMINTAKSVSDWTTGMRFQIEDETQANYGSVLIQGARSQKNKADNLWRLASLEREAASTVIKTADGYKLYTDKTLRNQNEQTQHIKRLKKEGVDLLSELEKEDYRYTIDGKTQNYSAREVIDTIKNNLDKDLADFKSNYIKVTPDFLPTMQGIIDKTRSRRTVKTETGTLDITEIPVTFMEKYYMDPITKPGAIVSKDAKKATLEEVAALSRETTYKEHSLGWRNVEEYNKIYNRPLKEVYALRHVQGLFKDDNGLRVSLYDFFRNSGSKGIPTLHAKKYLNNLLWMINNKEPGWQEALEESFAKFHTLSWKQRLLSDSYEAYKKFEVEQDKYSWNENNNIEKSLSIARNYFERKNNATKRDGSPKRGHVPWKPETDVYSQYEHDIALASRNIKMDVWIRQKLRHDSITGFQPVGEKENYFPHLGYDTQELYKEILNEADRISRKVENPEERQKAIDALMRRHESIQEQSKKEDGGLADKARDNLLLKDMEGDRGIRALSSLGAGSRPGNMLTRKANLGGYKRDQAVIGEYKASVLNAIGTELQSVSFRRILNEFKKERPMGKHTKDWEMYMRIFARDMTGAPSTVSEDMLSSKTLNIKRTPWWYTSDQYLYSKKSVYNLVDKLSGRSKPNKFMKELYNKRQQGLETNGQMDLFDPKKNESFEQWWDKQRQTFATRYDKDGNAVEANMNWFSGQMKQYSQLEGKYQLATLLARMKVVVNNVFGGGTNAWVHIGAGPIRKSRKIDFWQSIDPRFKTMKDVDNWASELGIAEEMLKYDLGYLGMKRDPNWEVFSKEVAQLATEKWQNKGKDKLYDVRFRDLVKKHNIGSKAMDVAASFMGKSELFLRLNTFKAAYVAIRESMSPVEMKLNDPYLIEQAKKAVKASQFLYTAPFRPSFARTSAGKVYSRFKLWAWNSVKFRKDVYKEAKYAGFRPGSPEAKRLERMMTADLFMIGMAKLLPYTMFDYSLPAPYSYFQDTSDWLFGSDQQRERAFYGVLPKAIAPLHEFMPSILRGPEAIFGNLFSGNWERFADYTLVSHFPFGMLGRDVWNAVQSPALIGEFLTGVPLHRMSRLKDDIIEGKKAPAYSPGFF